MPKFDLLLKNKKNGIFIVILCLIITVCTSKSSVAKEFAKLPTFNWILTDNVIITKRYIDTKNLKTIDNKYKIYWEKFEKSNGEKFIAKYAIDCKRKIKTVLGGVIYNVNGYVIMNVEEYTENNFMAAPDWEYVEFNTDMPAKKVCSFK